MLTEIKKDKYALDIGAARLYLRFDNEAFYRIESAGVDFLDVTAINRKKAAVFIRYGIATYCEDHPQIDPDELTDKIMQAAKPAELISGIAGAVMLALPRPIIGAKPTGDGGKIDFAHIRALFCDIMGKPDELFWSSTLREILDRWDKYAIFMGYKKAPIHVKKYDDD